MVLLRGNNQLRNKFMFGTERKARENLRQFNSL